MQNKEERAKQFMPFEALNGLRETLNKISKKSVNRKTLFDDSIEILNNKIKILKKNDTATAKYYVGTEYIETTGIVKKIDEVKKQIYIYNSIINFDDLIELTINCDK